MRVSGSTTRLTALLAASVLVGGALSGCSGSPDAPAAADGPAGSTPSTSIPILVPGKPGEPASTGLPSTQSQGPAAEDVDFVAAMVPHHEQALEMSALAPDRARDPRVRRLAERIRAAQAPEILAMEQWLDDHGEKAMDHSGGHHGSHAADMPGMMTDREMRALRASRGTDFDRMFLHMMIRHHGGALEMADAATAGGRDVIAQELAADVSTSQTAEIDRMRTLLREL
ncbi:MAG: DUF305 domain-containing protein [Actinomycetes bacterium]